MRSLPALLSRHRLPVTPALLAGVVLAFGLLTLLPATPAAADGDRPTTEVDGHGAVPAYRTNGPTLLVCPTTRTDFDNRISAFADDLKAANVTLWNQCQTGGFHNLQD